MYRIMADGAYDSRQIFSYLDDLGIDPAMRVHRNSVVSANRDCPARMNAVMRQTDVYDMWRDSVSYGMRWIAESVFSSLKRMFGEEAARSRNKDNMMTELMPRTEPYDRFVRKMASAG